MGRLALVAGLLLLGTCEAADPQPAKAAADLKAPTTCLSFDFSDCASGRPNPLPVHTHCTGIGMACDSEADKNTCCKAHANCKHFKYCGNTTKLIDLPENTACKGTQCTVDDKKTCCMASATLCFWPFNGLCETFGLDIKADPTIFFASVVSLVVVFCAVFAMLFALVKAGTYPRAVIDCTKLQFEKGIHFFSCGYFFNKLSSEIQTDVSELRLTENAVRQLQEPFLQQDVTPRRQDTMRQLKRKERAQVERLKSDSRADEALDNFAVTTRACMVIIMLGFFIQVSSHIRADSEDTKYGFNVYPTIQMAIHKSREKNLILVFIPIGFVCLLCAWVTAEYVRLRKKDEKFERGEFRRRGAPLDHRGDDGPTQTTKMQTIHASLKCKAPYCNDGKLIRLNQGGRLSFNFLECPTCKGDSHDFKPKLHDSVYVTHTDFYPEFMGRCGTIEDIKDGSQTLSHKVIFADTGDRGRIDANLPYGWFRRNALVLASVVDATHYICVRQPPELSGRYYRDEEKGGAYVHETKDYEMKRQQRRWFWGKRGGQLWFTSFEDTLIPPIPPALKPPFSLTQGEPTEDKEEEEEEEAEAGSQHWQQEIGTGQKLPVDFDVYYANRSKRSYRNNQDDDFRAHIMKSYNNTLYAQTSRHKRLTSNSLLIQVFCLMAMWLWPTNDVLPCGFKHGFSDSASMPLINWTLEAIRTANQINATYSDETLPLPEDDLKQYENFVCVITQWGKLALTCSIQTGINTMAWNILNLCSFWTAIRAMWVQGLVKFTSPYFGPFFEGFGVDPLTYFVAFMQIVGVLCYMRFLHVWSGVRCQEAALVGSGTVDCSRYCNSAQEDTFRKHAEKIDIMGMHIGARIWEETSVVFALLAMFSRVCRDFAVSKGAWQQRYSIFIPFALLMLHSLVTQNSLVIIPGVTIFVLATFFSARIGKI